MSRKELTLVASVGILGVLYIVFFTSWFRAKPIHIEHTIRPGREIIQRGNPSASGHSAANIIFALGREYNLTSLKVVVADVYATNKNAPPLWHLVADSSPEPVKGFVYGGDVPGLKPFLGGGAMPLEPGVQYHLLLEAGKLKGEHDFSVPVTTTARR